MPIKYTYLSNNVSKYLLLCDSAVVLNNYRKLSHCEIENLGRFAGLTVLFI